MSESTQTHPVILFDGVCNLCNSAVRFIIPRDKTVIFRFAALQSEFAQRTLANRLGPAQQPLSTLVLVDGDHIFTKSSAVLRICTRLRGLWPLCSVGLLIPGPLRDAIYDYIAKHRYAWFGQSASCMVPTSDIRERFL